MKSYKVLVKIKKSILVGLFFLVSGCHNDDTNIKPLKTLFNDLHNALDIELNKSDGKGISAAVMLQDGELWTGVSGVSYGTTQISTEMLFGTGSMGKMFTAATILQLAEEGLLNLGDPLHKWLSAYPNIDSTITIKQLLNHTSGLANTGDHPDYVITMFTEPAKFWTPEEIITRFTAEPLFPKGTDWHYSNINYILLGMIIEEVTGSEIAVEFRDRLFDPLNLSGTYFAEEESIPGIIAHGWSDFINGTIEEISYFPKTAIYSSGWTAGAQFSTAKDLARWAHALFHDGSVISQAMLDQMLTFYSPCTGEEFLAAGYGLGVTEFQPEIVNNLLVWGHGGDGFGYTAACMYLPEYGVSIGIMENIEGGKAMPPVISTFLSIIKNNLEEMSVPR